MSKAIVSEHARALSRRGAKKGGQARASVLTGEERSEIARAAVVARWQRVKGPDYTPPDAVTEPTRLPVPAESDATPFSMFPGTLNLGGVEVEVHVLNDGKRVLTQREMVRVLSGGRESGNLQRYLERNPLTANMVSAGPNVVFKLPGSGTPHHGYEATFLVEVCSKYLEAREADLLRGRQLELAKRAEIVVRACAKVGIIALIDEATGFQKVRSDQALRLKLQAFISADLQEWARMFPEEFWLELARLEGIRYSARSRPLRWGKYVMAFVYDAVDKDVGNKLRKINPNPHFGQNHHQWLREFGREKVNNQLQRVIAVMKLCDGMEEFKAKFARVFKKSALQITFDDINWGAPA